MIVTWYVPAGVELAVVTVSVEVPAPPLIELGLKVPTAPVGSPLAFSATAAVNPFKLVTEVEKVVFDPALTVRLTGDALRANPADAFTINVALAVSLSVPLMAITVKVYVPTGVEVLEVVTLSVDVPEPPMMFAGLNVPTAPVGRPFTDKATAPLKPLDGETVSP